MAFAIKLADAVVKSMATSFALVVVVAAEMLLLGSPADPVAIPYIYIYIYVYIYIYIYIYVLYIYI